MREKGNLCGLPYFLVEKSIAKTKPFDYFGARRLL